MTKTENITLTFLIIIIVFGIIFSFILLGYTIGRDTVLIRYCNKMNAKFIFGAMICYNQETNGVHKIDF